MAHGHWQRKQRDKDRKKEMALCSGDRKKNGFDTALIPILEAILVPLG